MLVSDWWLLSASESWQFFSPLRGSGDTHYAIVGQAVYSILTDALSRDCLATLRG